MWKSLFGGKKKKGSGLEVGGNKELLTLAMPVKADAETAFRTFVDELGSWWPRDYTWAGDKLKDITIDPRYNGECVEVSEDGTRKVWGTVLSINRPDHLVIAWQISPDRAQEDSQATASRVDVRFSSGDDGSTTVLVVHRDFPRHGDGWEGYRNEMAGDKGWPLLMERYAAAFGDG